MQFSCYHRHHQNTEGQMVFHVHPAMTGVWQCCMDDGSWTDYDDETSGMLDDAFTSGATRLASGTFGLGAITSFCFTGKKFVANGGAM